MNTFNEIKYVPVSASCNKQTKQTINYNPSVINKKLMQFHSLNVNSNSNPLTFK